MATQNSREKRKITFTREKQQKKKKKRGICREGVTEGEK